MNWLVRLALEYPSYLQEQIDKQGPLNGIKTGIVDPPRVFGRQLKKRTARFGSQYYIKYSGNPGTQVWDKEWDILLILDACRVDLIKEIASEYPFLGTKDDVGTLYSVGSISNDWIRRTFSEEFKKDIERSAYITGNCFTAKTEFTQPKILDEVWKYEWDDGLSTIPARSLTDRAIETWRSKDIDRMIVHYMQPHVPFVNQPDLGEYGEPEDFGDGFAKIWKEVGKSLDYDEVWRAYQDNLRYVLDDVSLLLENVNADTVAISSDHGNAIGEWGNYGHPPDLLLDCVREVPWITTTARNNNTYDPNTAKVDTENADEINIEERLEALGYK